MARHSDIDELQPARREPAAGPGRRRRWVLPLIAALAVVALAGSALVAGTRWTSIRESLATAPLVGAECPSERRASTSITVNVAPEIAQTVQRVVSRVNGRELRDGSCLDVSVVAQSPAQTVAGAAFLPPDRAPELWIPDSSIWTARLERWKARRIGRFATSPVVLATSRTAATARNWQNEPPTWQAALTGPLPVAAPDLTDDATTVVAMLALVQSMGGGEATSEAVAAAVLSTKRAGTPSVGKALAAAQAGSENAPLIPLSEQAVLGVTRVTSPQLVVVYPRGASAALDYPLLQVREASGTPEKRQAVDVVRSALTSEHAQELVREAGLRDADGTPPPGVPASARTLPSSDPLPADQVTALVQQIASLAIPTRLLAVVDVSPSMQAAAGNGMSRSAFASLSAKTAGQLMPDVAQVGVWGFSRDLEGTRNFVELRSIAPLGANDGNGGTQREAVYSALDGMPARLGGNGTAIYATTVAAMKHMRKEYDRRAANAVVVMTDGSNEDPGGPSLDEAVRQITALTDPRRPIRLIMIGIGPEAELAQLQRLAAPTGGAAYLAKDPQMLPKVLLKTMTQRDQ